MRSTVFTNIRANFAHDVSRVCNFHAQVYVTSAILNCAYYTLKIYVAPARKPIGTVLEFTALLLRQLGCDSGADSKGSK